MSVYWIVMITSSTFAAGAQWLGKANHRALSLFWVWMTALVLICYSGLRYQKGDTHSYWNSFIRMPFEFAEIFYERSHEKGFTIFTWAIKVLWDDPQVFVFLTALITLVCIFVIFYKYSLNFGLSVFLFIASNAYGVTMNGMRQYLASAVVFAGFRWLIEGKWLHYCLLVLFASTLHTSALALIPVYFIVRRRAWSWSVMLLALSAVVAFAFLAQLLPGLFSLIDSPQYSRYEDYIASQPERGANVLRVVIAALPLLIAYKFREQLRRSLPYSDILVNISLLNGLVLLYATYNWIFARYCIYFEVYNMLLIPLILHVVLTGKPRVYAYIGLLIFYLILFHYGSVLPVHNSYISLFFPNFL